MDRQKFWAGWFVLLAPGLTFANDRIDLDLTAGEPLSALDAYAALSHTQIHETISLENQVTAVSALGPITLKLELQAATNKYWLGLDCDDEQQSLVVLNVVEGSPAAAAGLKVDDVVTLAKLGEAEHALSSVEQFSALVQSARNQPLTLTVTRDGQPTTVAVTPAERPTLILARADGSRDKGDSKAERGDHPRKHRHGAARGKHGDKKREGHRHARSHHRRHHQHGFAHQRGHRQHGRGHAFAGPHPRHGWGMSHGRHSGHGRQGHFGHLAGRHGHGRHFGHFAGHHRGMSRGYGVLAMRHGHHGFGHQRFGFHGHGRFGTAWGGRGGRYGFGQQFALHQHRGSEHGPHAWRGAGQHFQRTVSQNRPSDAVTNRLETLVKRLEELTGPQGLGRMAGRPTPASAGGFGGFRGFGRPESNRPEGEGRPQGRPGQSPQRSAQRDDSSLGDLRGQVHHLQEQQEQIMKTLRDLSEKLERNSRR